MKSRNVHPGIDHNVPRNRCADQEPERASFGFDLGSQTAAKSKKRQANAKLRGRTPGFDDGHGMESKSRASGIMRRKPNPIEAKHPRFVITSVLSPVCASQRRTPTALPPSPLFCSHEFLGRRCLPRSKCQSRRGLILGWGVTSKHVKIFAFCSPIMLTCGSSPNLRSGTTPSAAKAVARTSPHRCSPCPIPGLLPTAHCAEIREPTSPLTSSVAGSLICCA